MGTEFTPIFLFILVAIFTAIGMLVSSAILGPRRTTPVKQMPYESGMDPIGDARQRFDVRYYLVAIAFLLFDVELLYLYPWAVAQWSYGQERVVAAEADPEVGEAGPVAEDLGAVDIDVDEDGVDLAGAAPPADSIAPDGDEAVAVAAMVGIPPAFRNLVFGEIMVFVIVLTAAFAYAWRKGVFEWR